MRWYNQDVSKMTGRLGLSTSTCAGEIKKATPGIDWLSEDDLARSYLVLVDDFAKFAADNGFAVIEMELGFSLISAGRLAPFVGQIKEAIRPFDTVCCHLPLGEINISALNPEMRRHAVEETKRHIDLCEELGIRNLVMHPGSFAAMPDRYSLLADQTRRTARESVLGIRAYCDRKGMELSLENLHRNEPLFHAPDEFEPLVQEGTGMVLDTLHAFSAGVDPLDFIARFGRQLTEVHLTDGIGGDPFSDCAVGRGDVDCLAVLHRLAEIEFGGRIVLEVLSKEAVIDSKEFLRRHGYFG
jgi:sugar phosphate isomerase/epimerase